MENRILLSLSLQSSSNYKPHMASSLTAMRATAACIACAPERMALLGIIVISGHAEVEAANDISCFIRSRKSRRSVPCQENLPAWGSCLRPSKPQTRTVLHSFSSSRELCRYACPPGGKDHKRDNCGERKNKACCFSLFVLIKI